MELEEHLWRRLHTLKWVQQVKLWTTGISRGFTNNSKEKQKVCEGLKLKKETIYK